MKSLWIEMRKTIVEVASPRRLAVTLAVGATMGAVEWMGSGSALGMGFGILMALLALMVAPLPWQLLLPWGLRRPPSAVFARTLAVAMVSAVVVTFAFALYFALADAVNPVHRNALAYAIPHLSAWSSVVISIALFIAAGWGVSRHMELERRLEVHDAREVALRGALDEARMMALQSRLDPHFLFNGLNLIAELCREDPSEAERCVLLLGRLLRCALEHTEQIMVPLARELDLCSDYFALCQARFGTRMQVRWERDSLAESVLVPTLAVQVLCENAVRHGVEKSANGGVIVVRSCLQVSKVTVVVTSPGPFRGERKAGMGLELTRRRLELVFREKAKLIVASSSDGTRTTATLEIPREVRP